MYSQPVQGYQISPYMQEKMVYAAQTNCYEESAQVLKQFLNIPVSTMQIHRVANSYGALLEKENVACLTLPQEKQPSPLPQGEVVYAQADGSMIFTREEGWKEVKVGRIFKSSDCLATGATTERGWIKASEYEAYLGGHSQFTRRFENKLDCYSSLGERLIFITDGAVWMRNWITDTYPRATQILDWYHCLEHLQGFAAIFFGNDSLRQQWVEQQTELLYNSQAAEVMQHIRTLKTQQPEKKKARQQLLDYYQSNLNRMDYQKYLKMGAGIIGSGAIEAAHRTLIQKRMKLSGQRWSKTGAQQMLQIRATNLSGKWNHIIELINQPPAIAA